MPIIATTWCRLFGWIVTVVLTCATAVIPEAHSVDELRGASWSAADRGTHALVACLESGAKIVRAPATLRNAFVSPHGTEAQPAPRAQGNVRPTTAPAVEAVAHGRPSLVGTVELRI